MNEFQKYKILKDTLDIEYKGIKLNRVLAGRIWYIANKGVIGSWKSYFYIFFSINIKKIIFDPNKHIILSTIGRYARRDYLELYQAVLEKLDGKASYNNTMEFGYKFCFHPIIIMNTIYRVFICLSKERYNVFLKLKIAFYFIHYMNIIEELEKINFSCVSKYLSMCNMSDLENLLTQYMKNRNIKTFSLQEGIYHIFNINIPLGSIVYENFETDNLLCWGEYSVNEMLKYGITKDRLIVAGYPKKITAQTIKRTNSFEKAVVLLGGDDNCIVSNTALIDILIHLSKEYLFSIKCHPSSNLEYYQKIIKGTTIIMIDKEILIKKIFNNEEFDFVIAVNTTSYYEALMYGIPCFRFSDGSFDMMDGYNDIFCNSLEFKKRISEIKNKDITKYQEEIDSILKYVTGYGIDNYRKILIEDIVN